MNHPVKNGPSPAAVFSVTDDNFLELSLSTFAFQYAANPLYRRFCDKLGRLPGEVRALHEIPFLPISFFKTHEIKNTDFVPEVIFESSGTTGMIPSRHFVKDLAIYEQSFRSAFRKFYGEPADWCILALLPGYLERDNSSLVLMADRLIQQSRHPLSGFYLHEFEALAGALRELEASQQPTLLLGVTFALLDFAERHPMKLGSTTVIETGGMKGRRKEITRPAVHDILRNAFSLDKIHSEYGMTELLSQAYSKGDGRFACPTWMRILLREEDDPLNVMEKTSVSKAGAINVIDLANIYSCSFIATDDAARLYPDASFEVLGRLGYSDVRGCSLMAL